MSRRVEEKKSAKKFAQNKTVDRKFVITSTIILAVLIIGVFELCQNHIFVLEYTADATSTPLMATSTIPSISTIPPLNKALYDADLNKLAHIVVATSTPLATTSATSTVKIASTTPKVLKWPVKTVYPNAGALLPFNRIVAYYGNFYSKAMGVLGQYPEETVIQKLKDVSATWQAADPTTPVIPAIDYIAVTAQGSAGADGKYRLRMPDSQIDQALEMANQVNGIVVLDIQVGLSNVQTEVPLLEKYLKMPNVHLALDPEFSMKTGAKPGTVIGTMDATDINFAANYLAKLVQDNNLPPKILVVHRFTQPMVTNYKNIKPLPEVQIVMDMDGWGPQSNKIHTYQDFIAAEPVQFTGMKLFYKNDLLNGSAGMLSPKQVLNLTPSPSFIQYQ